MLHAVTREHAEGPIVHRHGELHDRRPARLLDDLDERGVELQARGGFLELEPGVFERVELLLKLGSHVHPTMGDAFHGLPLVAAPG